MNKSMSIVPNAFYDLIVFLSSSILFVFSVAWGLGYIDSNTFKEFDAKYTLIVAIGLFFFSYEYGRIAEAWSASIVQAPLRFIHNRTRFLNSNDFLLNLDHAEELLGLKLENENRKGGKWSIYFYAMLIDQKIGTDLLKRYAWEKLSRSSAFTFFVLFVISFSCYILSACFSVAGLFYGEWRFGSVQLTLLFFVFVVLTYYEYYKRNCWNNDLLLKVASVLVLGKQLQSSPISIEGSKIQFSIKLDE